jgi:hypothetical protein
MIRQCRIYLLHDEDWDRAVDLLHELGAFSEEELSAPPPAKKVPMWVMVLIGVVAALFLGAALGN